MKKTLVASAIIAVSCCVSTVAFAQEEGTKPTGFGIFTGFVASEGRSLNGLLQNNREDPAAITNPSADNGNIPGPTAGLGNCTAGKLDPGTFACGRREGGG
jgi:hypothetical protein